MNIESPRKARKTGEDVCLKDIEDHSLLNILDFLSFTDQYHLSLASKRFHTFIYKRTAQWKYVSIIDVLNMCQVPLNSVAMKVSPKRLHFGLSRVDHNNIRKIVIPYQESLSYILSDPPFLPRVKSLTMFVNSIPAFEHTVEELTKYLPLLPPNLQVLIFDINPVVLDDQFKKKGAFSRNFRSDLMKLREALEKKGVQFNMSLCKKCSTPIHLKNKCGECQKLICCKCTTPRRCVLCMKVHCKEHIKSQCQDCGRNYFLCRFCKQKDYESCFECDRTFCEKHEKFMNTCTICSEVFCDDNKKCIYQCDGCDKLSCLGCELNGCPNCGNKFCPICVNNNQCFVNCEVCDTRMCERCVMECKDCLAQVCKWCGGSSECCVSSDEEEKIEGGGGRGKLIINLNPGKI